MKKKSKHTGVKSSTRPLKKTGNDLYGSLERRLGSATKPTLFILVFALIGVIGTFLIFAAPFTASFEVESSTRVGNMSLVSESGASNGSVAKFGEESPASTITHGQQINASNTGINAAGVTASSLTSRSGGTFSTNNQVFENQRFTSGVRLNGSNIVIRNSIIEVPEGYLNNALEIYGDSALIENVYIRAAGGGGFTGILVKETVDSATIRRVDVSNFENIVTYVGNNVTIEESFLHDPKSETKPEQPHHDVIEVYGGTNLTITKSRLTMWAEETAPINVASVAGWDSIDNVTVTDNYLDGGNMHFVFDRQGDTITNVKVFRNRLGGATNPWAGRYNAYRSMDGNDPVFVRTTAAQASNPVSVLWPISGVDVNTWAVEQGITPDRTGQIAQ